MSWMQNRYWFNPESFVFSKATCIISLGELMLLQILGTFVFPHQYIHHIIIYLNIYTYIYTGHTCDIKQKLGENKQNDKASIS